MSSSSSSPSPTSPYDQLLGFHSFGLVVISNSVATTVPVRNYSYEEKKKKTKL